MGPGARLAELLPVLVPASDGGDCVRLLRLDGLAALLRPAVGVERLVLDAEALALEDAGLVRLWLAADPARELVLAGDDATRRTARRLLAEPRARWLAWPPDLDDLKRLLRAPSASRAEPSTAPPSAASAVSNAAGPETADMDALGEELSQIEAILGAPLDRRRAATEAGPSSPAFSPRAAPTASPAPATPAASLRTVPPPSAPNAPTGPELDLEPLETEHEFVLTPKPRPVDLDDLPPLELERQAGPRTFPAGPPARDVPPPAPKSPSEAPRAPAPYFQHQVADLADLAQRIELGLTQVREGAQASEESADALAGPLDELGQDVARLLQFTRTLGFLVAPPGRGAQRFDLGELVDVFTRALVERGAEGPRCLARKSGPAPVRSDRQLVAQALDALFFVAAHAAAPGEIVRVKLETSAGTARLSIEFPAGPLDGLDSARILEPYALRRVLPELGANALSAAAGIVRGQGGELELVRKGERHLEWSVRFPLAPDADTARPNDHDPFA